MGLILGSKGFIYSFYGGLVVNGLLCLLLISKLWNSTELRMNAPFTGSRPLDPTYSPIDIHNASAVFNEVYDALKQKNSVLHPSGVSLFSAYVPKGTRLYHSNRNGQIPDQFEWVAMDEEFSYSFIHFGKNTNKHPRNNSHSHPPPASGGLHPPSWGTGPPTLMTFETTAPLKNLLYLGGASAAKQSQGGEMDTQILLAQLQNATNYSEWEGSNLICKWGNSNGRRLDGIIRVEIGFEIIICDFHRDMKLVSNITLAEVSDLIHFKDDELEEVMSNQFSALASYDQIEAGGFHHDGERRILLDQSKYISFLNKSWIDPDTYTRRVADLPIETRNEWLGKVDQLLRTKSTPYQSTNWQLISEGIVKKFTPILKTMELAHSVYQKDGDVNVLSLKLMRLAFNIVRRYVDAEDVPSESWKSSIETAINDYIYPLKRLQTEADLLIYSSMYTIQEQLLRLCFDTFKVSRHYIETFEDLSKEWKELGQRTNELISTLQWASFFKCKDVCNWDQLCYVPSWGPSPLGFSFRNKFGVTMGEDGVARIDDDFICIDYETILNFNQF
ncbi:hypothetical protein LJB42_001499 [Komagataella kurtzmanii]|nr:hypothetical protein LJB42_001499 [Komagataella kurtzmanii]